MLNCPKIHESESLMKNYFPLLMLSACLVLFSFSTLSTEKKSLKQTKTVLVFGDSLSAAYNIPREQGWVSLLQDFVNQQKLDIQFVNASISGETTSGGLTRLKAQLELYNPDVVILELGGNDGLRGFDLTTTGSNLEKMVALCITHSSKVLLAGIQIPPNYGRTYTRRFSAIYTELEKKKEVELIPFILEGVAAKDEFMQQDGIHPNEKGQPFLRETVWKYLKPMLN